MITSRHGPDHAGLSICISQERPPRDLEHTFVDRDDAKRFVLELMALFAEVTWAPRSHTHALIYGTAKKGVA